MVSKIKAAILNMLIAMLTEPKEKGGISASPGEGNAKPKEEVRSEKKDTYDLFTYGIQRTVNECRDVISREGSVKVLTDKLTSLMTEQYKREIAMTFDRPEVLGLNHGKESMDLVFGMCDGFGIMAEQSINVKLAEFSSDSDKERFLVSSIICFTSDTQDIFNIFLDVSMEFNKDMLMQITKMISQVASGEAITFPSPHQNVKVKVSMPQEASGQSTLGDYVSPDFKMNNVDLAALLKKAKGQKKN